MITLTIVPNVVLQPVIFMLPLFTDAILQRGADVGGYMLAINGFGGLLMALTIASFGFFFRRGLVCIVMAMASSVLALAFTQTTLLPVALVAIALFAASQTAFRTTAGTLTQTLVPDELRGRVTSLQSIGHGFVVGSSLLVGWFAGSKVRHVGLGSDGFRRTRAVTALPAVREATAGARIRDTAIVSRLHLGRRCREHGYAMLEACE